MQYQSLRAIHDDLRTGATSAQALMEHCAGQYDKTESDLNAYKTWNGETALKQAKAMDTLMQTRTELGPLMGIPVSVKDLFGVPGLPTFAGSSQALPASWEQAGDIVRGMQQQGCLVTGKTHTVEFAFGGIGMNAHWGAPVNPWDAAHARIPGGSSSGAGVSLSQGSALLALGSDTAGSVRIPASLTGNVALKMTNDRWPCTGAVPLSSTLDTPGVLARSVEDTIFGFSAVEQALTGRPVHIAQLDSLQGVRVGIPENFFWDDVDASIAAAVEDAIRKLEGMGAKVSRVTLPGCDDVYELFQAGGLGAPELSSFLNCNMPEKIAHLDPLVQLRVEGAESISSVEYLRRRHVIRQASLNAARFFTDFDVLVTPTVAISAPKIADLQDTAAYRHANMMVLRNTSIANLMSLCGITMPVGLDSQGIPIGLQLMGGPGAEETTLAIAGFIEQKLGVPAQLLGTAPRLA